MKLDTSICPLCGKPNNCCYDKIMKNEMETCWCASVVIPSELIMKVPEDKRNKVCICKECIDKYHAQKNG